MPGSPQKKEFWQYESADYTDFAGAPSKAHTRQLVQIQHEERDTWPQYIVCEGYKPRNSADLGGRRSLRERKAAITAPKLMHLVSWNIAVGCERQGDVSQRGLRPQQGIKWRIWELRRPRMLSQGVCDIKPVNGKILQTAFWESNQFVVPFKHGNSCGGKGLTVEPLRQGFILYSTLNALS